jgi:hypothetical protein
MALSEYEQTPAGRNGNRAPSGRPEFRGQCFGSIGSAVVGGSSWPWCSSLGMVLLVDGLVATAETVPAGVLISTVGLMMMVAVAVAVIRWRRHS